MAQPAPVSACHPSAVAAIHAAASAVVIDLACHCWISGSA